MTKLTSGNVKLATFNDMRNRYNIYVKNYKKLPAMVFLVKNGMDYVPLNYFDVMVANYDKYVKAKGTEPSTIEITTTLKTFTVTTGSGTVVTPTVFVPEFGYFVNPEATPYTKIDFVSLKNKGITCIYYRILESNYTQHADVLAKIKAAGLKPYAWVWEGFRYGKELAELGWHICIDVENYNMIASVPALTQLRTDTKGKTLIICTKPTVWDGNQQWKLLIPICDYIMPMLYLEDYGKNIVHLEAYLKTYYTAFPGKIYPALETYISDANPVAKSKEVLQAEIDICKKYSKGIALFRYGLSNLETTTTSTTKTDDGWRTVPSYKMDYQDTGYNCGPTSMSMGLTELFPGTGSRETELAKYGWTTTSGTGHPGMQNIFKTVMTLKGLKYDMWEEDLSTMTLEKLGAKLEDPNVFVVCHGDTGGWTEGGWQNSYGHYVYPIGVNVKTGEYKIADPTKGVITYSKAGFEKGLKMISQKSFLIFAKK